MNREEKRDDEMAFFKYLKGGRVEDLKILFSVALVDRGCTSGFKLQ